MTDSITRRILFLTLLLLLSTVLVAQAKEEQIYTIKKGDTLWGISQRFIDDPYYWPNMWADNPDITNPHLIFPGQKIRVIDGRLEIIPAYPGAEDSGDKAEPGEVTQALPETEPEAIVRIKSTGSGDGFILTNEQPLGTLVDSVDNRVLLTDNDLVFVKMKDPASATVGDTYGLFSRGKQIVHPQTEEPIGTMMHALGALHVTGVNETIVTARIGESYREIERGAQLFPYNPPRKELTLRRGQTSESGLIVASRDNKPVIGAHEVVFINLGSEQGIQPGNLFYISRPRHLSDALKEQVGEVDLPEAVLGAAVVIEPQERTSSAIIIKSVDGIEVGDRVTIATD